jgi:predicted membrane GTPase involved in stress response
VTPNHVRLRKVTLPLQERAKAARRGRPPSQA